MKKYLWFVFGLFGFHAQAQKKIELVNDDIAIIEYEITKNEVIFYMESGGSGSVKVDVNGNGKPDGKLDRSYGKTRTWEFCTQFLLDETHSSVCGGAPSKASMIVDEYYVVYRIPKSELSSSRKPKEIKVLFQIYIEKDGKSYFHYYPGPGAGFENTYTITF
jgi:hypothetical protein